MDEGLRESERRSQASGTAEDERLLLSARLRAGLVTEAGLGLAAYAGHAAARLIAGTSEASRRLDPAWLEGLAPWGRMAWVRTALAATHAAWPRERPTSESRQEAYQVVERWLASPESPRDEIALGRDPFFGARDALLIATGEARRWNRMDIALARGRKGGVAENAAVGLSLKAAASAVWAITSEAPGRACFIACQAAALALAPLGAAEVQAAADLVLAGEGRPNEVHHAALAERMLASLADTSRIDEVVRGEVAAWALGQGPEPIDRLRREHRKRVTPPDPCRCLPTPGSPDGRAQGVTWKAYADSQAGCKVHRQRQRRR